MTIATPIPQGLIIEPGAERWDAARAAWNLAVDQHPAAVALVTTPAEAISAVRAARDNGWRVAPQSTGHNAAPLGDLSGSLLAKTAGLDGVVIDPRHRTARVGAGALFGAVAHAAAAHGLAPLAGSSPDVAVAGYLLGGGLSPLGRRHGLAANTVRSVDIVTPDAVLRHCTDLENPDLFWALRGGGGGFGVVTGFEIGLVDVPAVYAGSLLWPLHRAPDLFPRWREWARSLEPATATCVRLLRLPPLPEIPAPLRGGAFTVIEVAHLGDEASGIAVSAPLRALRPDLDMLGTTVPEALVHLHMDPEHPVPAVAEGALLDALPDEAVEALLAVAGPESDCSLLAVEIRALGGRLAEPAGHGGAVSCLEAPYFLTTAGVAPPPEVPAMAEEVSAVVAALQPWLSDNQYLNLVERPMPARRLWQPATLRRLRDVADRYDPDGVMHPNHPLR